MRFRVQALGFRAAWSNVGLRASTLFKLIAVREEQGAVDCDAEAVSRGNT